MKISNYSKLLADKIIDDFYPRPNIEFKKRNCVRGVIFNDKDEIALLYINGTDIFGKRDHFELPGGGIEDNESFEEALEREIDEELGYTIKDIKFLGIIENEYNLLKRSDKQHFFMANINEKTEQHLLEYEKELFGNIVFIHKDKIIEMYENYTPQNVGIEIHKRDLIAIKEALKNK